MTVSVRQTPARTIHSTMCAIGSFSQSIAGAMPQATGLGGGSIGGSTLTGTRRTPGGRNRGTFLGGSANGGASDGGWTGGLPGSGGVVRDQRVQQ